MTTSLPSSSAAHTMTTLSTAGSGRGGDGAATRSWSDLPEGPLHIILTCLCSLVDFVSFKSVCRSWRAVGSSLSSSVITSHFPPLLLSRTFSDRHTLSGFGVRDPAFPSFFRSLSGNLETLLALKYQSHIHYSHGHLLGLFDDRIVIINHFAGSKFYTPGLPGNFNSIMRDFQRTSGGSYPLAFCVLTSPVTSPGSGILLYTMHQLFYWRIGSPSWSCHRPRSKLWFAGIVTVRGTVYVMDPQDYSLSVLEFSPELHLRPLAVQGIKRDSYFHQHYLVDCDGELLHVRLEKKEGKHSPFEVFRLDSSVNEPRWVKKETLGNWAIFVGYDFSLPGHAVEKPERWGGRSNCIYYSRANENQDSSFVVFKLGDEIDLSDNESPLHPLHRGSYSLLSEWFHPGF